MFFSKSSSYGVFHKLFIDVLFDYIMVREEAVAGQFYESDPEKLKKQIENCFKGKFGAGMSEHKKTKNLFGVIVPHAGYIYSGQCASHAYKAIAEAEQPDVFIILGVNHVSYEKGFITSLDDFSTPLGIVKNDKDFVNQLIKESIEVKKIKKTQIKVVQSEEAHALEHSIEVQLPFLQYVTDIKKLKIVPIILSDYTYDGCKALAQLIFDVSKKQKKKICIIASSDFTHYGSSYGFMPFSDNIKEHMYEIDKGAIERIIKMDAKNFSEYSRTLTICGSGAIMTAIELCKLLGAKKTELLKYYTSGDIVNNYDNAVGYAAISFR